MVLAVNICLCDSVKNAHQLCKNRFVFTYLECVINYEVCDLFHLNLAMAPFFPNTSD